VVLSECPSHCWCCADAADDCRPTGVHVCVCVSLELLEEKISSHSAEAPATVRQLQAEVDALHTKLEVAQQTDLHQTYY